MGFRSSTQIRRTLGRSAARATPSERTNRKKRGRRIVEIHSSRRGDRDRETAYSLSNWTPVKAATATARLCSQLRVGGSQGRSGHVGRVMLTVEGLLPGWSEYSEVLLVSNPAPMLTIWARTGFLKSGGRRGRSCQSIW